LVERHTTVVLPALSVVTGTVAGAATGSDDAEPCWAKTPPRRLLGLVNPTPMPDPGLPALDWTQRRFEVLRQFYPDRFEVISGAAATERALRNSPGPVDVLYLASHGQSYDGSDATPLDSYIALAPTDEHPGFLRVTDILRMDIRARLVILGACRTGGGQVTGDGIVGLSRAFLGRGADALLMTLCEVSEQSSLDLVYRLHVAWRNGSPARGRAAAGTDGSARHRRGYAGVGTARPL
jgi:CHAT domain-containing protein